MIERSTQLAPGTTLSPLALVATGNLHIFCTGGGMVQDELSAATVVILMLSRALCHV